jgi:hypothetical protein
MAIISVGFAAGDSGQFQAENQVGFGMKVFSYSQGCRHFALTASARKLTFQINQKSIDILWPKTSEIDLKRLQLS